jgi:hypothetical protein
MPQAAATSRPLDDDQSAWGFVAVLALFTLALTTFCAINVHHLCHDAFFPPEAGMPRARTCNRLDTWHPSLSLVLGFTALTTLVITPLRRRPRWALVVTAVAAACLLAGVALLGAQDARIPSP